MNIEYNEIEDYVRCPYKYKLTNIDGDKGKPDIYTYVEKYIKGALTVIYNKEQPSNKLGEVYNRILARAEKSDLRFPNNHIGDRWKADMRLFASQLNVKEDVAIVGLPVRYKLSNEIFVNDILDLIYKGSDGKYILVNWSTSSRFTGDDADREGGRLVLQKLAVEKELGIKIDKVVWNMLRYVHVGYGNRKSIRNRRNWVSKTQNPIIKALKKHSIEYEEDIVRLMELASKSNSLKCLPPEVEEQFRLQNCLIEYEVTDDKIESYMDYIEGVINNIIDDKEFNPVNIDKSTDFFCGMLCNHRESCKYLKIYKGQEVSKEDKDLVDLFG